MIMRALKGLFAYPMPWAPGIVRGVHRARYAQCVEAYLEAADLATQVSRGLISSKEVQLHARTGLVRLFRAVDGRDVAALDVRVRYVTATSPAVERTSFLAAQYRSNAERNAFHLSALKMYTEL